MQTLLVALQVVTSLLLMFTILVQQRAAGLTATFGGMGTTYVQRRGAEKLLFQLSIALSILFFGLCIVPWYL